MRNITLALLACLVADPACAAPPPAMVLLGRGVQIYTCLDKQRSFVWHFIAPDAVLTDVTGHPVGHHFAGPSWQAADGSTIVGEIVVSSASAQRTAIPWLVLRAKAHTGEGIFSPMLYIVRTDTKGGLAPAGGCNAAHVNAENRVPYTATYIFFPG